MMKRKFAILASAAALLASLSATRARPQEQRPGPSLKEPYSIYLSRIAKGDYFGALLELQRREAEYRAAPQFRNNFLQLMSVVESQVGDYDAAYAYLDEFFGRQRKPEPDLKSSPLDDHTPLGALGAIRAAAAGQQVIMINEEHDTPMHRAFTTRLLPVLYAEGFRYLAAETLEEADTELQRRGYPTHKSGFYLADPVYGDMIRTALRLGFKVVPYECIPCDCSNPPDNPDFCQNERERTQAQNLYERIFRNDPKAKVLVHVGRGHHQELSFGNWAMMGWHFRQITKIDPFTINQMHMSERSRPESELALYRYAVDKWQIKEPTVFRSKDGKLWGRLGNDLVVFHPRTVYAQGRPLWLRLGGVRKPVPLHGVALKRVARLLVNAPGGPFLVQAFVEGEGDDAIPVDQFVVKNPKEAPALLLPRGVFRVRAVDASGKVVASAALPVK